MRSLLLVISFIAANTYLALAQEQIQHCVGQSCSNAILRAETDDSLSNMTLLQTRVVHPLFSTLEEDVVNLQELLDSSLEGSAEGQARIEKIAKKMNRWLEQLFEQETLRLKQQAGDAFADFAEPSETSMNQSAHDHGDHGVSDLVRETYAPNCTGLYSTNFDGVNGEWRQDAVTLRIFRNESNVSELLVKLNFEYGHAHCCTIEGNFLKATTWNATIDCFKGTIKMNTDKTHLQNWVRIGDNPPPISPQCSECIETYKGLKELVQQQGERLCTTLETVKHLIYLPPKCHECKQAIFEDACSWPGMYFGDKINYCYDCKRSDTGEEDKYQRCTPDPMYGGHCVAEVVSARTAPTPEKGKFETCGTTIWCHEEHVESTAKQRTRGCWRETPRQKLPLR